MRANRISWSALLLAVAFSATLHAKPNIIFYLADDQDIGDYGCYGNERVHTPAVDRLAKEGIRFTQAFTGQAICAPSRSQLYTGNYPLRNGAFLNHVPVKSDQVSIASHMEALGYEVVLAGKSHVKPGSVFNWSHQWEPVEKEGLPRKYIPLEQIENYFKKAEKPFCMFIASMYPHGKYFDVKGASPDSIKYYPYNQHLKSNQAQVDKKAGYYRSIAEDNTQLENVLDLVETHLDDNTLFIYSSDHGVSGKYSLYDRGLNVPLVARWPGVIEPGGQSDQLVHFTDVVPTFVKIAGGTQPENIDGKSFYSILKGVDEPIHPYVYGVRTNQNILAAKVFPSRMIRSQRYKYIRNLNALEVLDQNLGDNPRANAFIGLGAETYPNTPYEELYDLKSDPHEQNNLAQNPDYSEIKTKLAAKLIAWMKSQNDILTGEPGTMPLIHSRYKLDEPSRWNKVPEGLENTLKEEDYLRLHF